MIESPCFNCAGYARPGCDMCRGTGKERQDRMSAWSRRRIFYGSRDPRARSDGNEKWSRYTAEIPQEFDDVLAAACAKLGHRGKLDRAAVVRIALFHMMETLVPEGDAPIEASASDVVILPAIEAGATDA